MSSERRTERLAGMLLLLSFFLYLIHIVTAFTQGIELPTMFFYLLYGFSFSAAGVALYMVFREHDPVLSLFAGFWLVAHSLFAILEVDVIQAGLVFPEDFSFIPEETSPTAVSSIEVAMDKIGRSAYVFQGLGLLSVAVLAMRTGVVVPLVGWFGIAGGAMALLGGLVSLAGLVTYEAASRVFPFIALVTFLFILILGFKLYSRSLKPDRPHT